MKKWTVLPAVIVLAGIACCASAQQFITIGKLNVRADSPLAKGEYPRLLITRAQLPAIRARLEDAEIRTYLKQARDLIKIGQASPLLLGALYQVTGDKRYADMARKDLGERDWATFDLVAETMTEAQRREHASRMLASVKANRWRPRLLLALAAWGNGVDADLAPFVEAAHATEIARTIAYNNRWTRGRGGSSMSHGYHGEHFLNCELAAAVGWTHATGEDVLSRCDFACRQPAWYIYHYLPWAKRRRVLRVGVTRAPGHPHSLMPRVWDGESLIMLPITRTRDGLGQWWQREFIGNSPVPHWRKGQEHLYGLAGRILWLDPSIPSIPPAKYPPTRLFPENGHVAMRSDWTEDATVALFRCGRFGEIDGLWGRNNADNLHFIIYRGGHLAPDTGAVHHVNEGECKFVPGRTNVHEYGRQSIAHNTITVGREPLEHRGYKDALLGVNRRGGQTTIQEKGWFAKWGIKKPPGRGFKEGEIVAYETSPAFDYACGDATRSYPPSRVASVTRQFVFIRPDTFVVFDRVRPAKPELEVIWNFHALRQPAWNGQRSPDPAWPPERQFVIAADGKRVRNPHPGGHFVHTGGDAFGVTESAGELDLTLLLPAEADRIVRTIGGPWHDFEVDGVNYGPTEATYKVKRLHPNVGVGGWRIEVAAKRAGGEVRFLHVLRVGAKAKLTPAKVALLRQPGRVGVSISSAARSCDVTFDTRGPAGGHVKITRDGRPPIDEQLVRRVDDTYARWTDDPRHHDWMTNPHMRTVIFPYGKKPQ